MRTSSSAESPAEFLDVSQKEEADGGGMPNLDELRYARTPNHIRCYPSELYPANYVTRSGA